MFISICEVNVSYYMSLTGLGTCDAVMNEIFFSAYTLERNRNNYMINYFILKDEKEVNIWTSGNP